MPREAQEYGGYSSEELSPTLSSDGEQEPSFPRTLNLEFGPVKPQPPPRARAQADIDRKIREAARDVSEKQSVYHEQKLVYKDVVNEIDGLARQYNDEKRKVPIYPPKGTWFHHERKEFDRKKAEHEEKLRFILRLRQAVIDNDLPKAQALLSKATDAVNEAQTKLDSLRRERNLSEVEEGPLS
jgi:hypothetical protein